MPNIPIPLLFPILRDDDDFENLCLDLLRLHWNRPKLERFGRKGEKQLGIDILDVGGEDPLYAAQCKLREYGKTLSPTEISDEVDKARQFVPPLGKYGILTTAKISTKAQTRLLEINRSHKELGIFEVELFAWNKICELLQTYEAVRQDFYGPIAITSTTGRMDVTRPSTVEQSLEARVAITESNINEEIDSARDAIVRREFQIALLLLNRVQQRGDTTSITKFQRFRISSNLGAAELGLGRHELAARHFLEAVELEPHDERARVNEVFAYILKGEYSAAYTKAEALRSEYPESGKLASYWIMSAPRSVSLSTLEKSLSNAVKDDAEVCLALARRALIELDVAKGLAYAEAAAKAVPAWSQPQLVIAQANMGSIVRLEKGLASPPVPRPDLEHRIEDTLAEALRLAEAERDDRARVDALVLRTDLRLLQKRTADAEADAQAAHRIDPDNVQVMMALSEIHAAASRMDEAITLLERAHRMNPRADVELIYGRDLLRRGTSQDIATAVSILSAIDLGPLHPEMRRAVAVLAIQGMIRKDDPPSAATYLDRISANLDDTVLNSLRSYIAHREGRKTDALNLAMEAQATVEAASAETKEFLARLFMLLDRAAEALPLFREIFDLDTSTFDSGLLLDCAGRLHRDDVVIATCAKLQERGVDEWAVVSFEVQYLQKYSREKAVSRLNQFLAAHPAHKIATLMKSIIGVQSQRPDLVKGKISDLPSVEELSVENIIPAVHVLRFSGAGNDTVDYAYRFLRLHFDDIRAHQAVILSLVPGDPSIDIPPSLDVVRTGAAVCVQEELNGSLRWFVLEDTDNPQAEFEELARGSLLAAELLDKHIGDLVILARGHMQDRTGTIRQIMPKYVRRYQDCMSEMQLRFADASTIESVSIGSSEAEIGKSLEKILESLKKRDAAITRVRAIYDEIPMSLHLFGEQFGENAYIALLSLGQEDGQTVKCSLGTPEERKQGLFALQTCLALVVDLTAIATIRMIGVENLLKAKRFKLKMTESTWNELQETLVGDLFSGATGGTMSHHDGVTTFTEETADDKAKRRLRDQEFLELVKKTVEIVPVMEFAALDPASREPLEKMFGQYGAESIMLASNPDSVLWTDDLIQAQIAANEFGAKRAWTQLVVEQTAQIGQITDAEKESATAALIGMEYTATSFDSSALLRAVDMSDAIPWRRPLKQFIEVFCKPNGDLQALLGIFVDFLAKLYREPHLPESRCKVATAILDALWRNVPLRLPLLRLRKASSQFFGLNPVGQAQFDQCFDQWYGAVTDKIVTL